MLWRKTNSLLAREIDFLGLVDRRKLPSEIRIATPNPLYQRRVRSEILRKEPAVKAGVEREVAVSDLKGYVDIGRLC
jgi:hypothetical protein